MLRATSPRKSETQRSALFSGLSQFLQPPGPRQDFQLLSHSCLAFPCSWPPWGRAAPPSPNPRRALASMTANPLHHLGLIRAQWQMISLHIKALKQLNKLAPSQSPAQELALNSEALPAGPATLVKKAPAPHAAAAQRKSSVSQVKKWISAVSQPSCARGLPRLGFPSPSPPLAGFKGPG